MAFGKLIKHDIVLGPSIDGGYYLIGLRKLQKEVFVNINWGTREVFHQTKEIIKTGGLNVSFVPECYDIDDGEGLNHLIGELKEKNDEITAFWTRKYLNV